MKLKIKNFGVIKNADIKVDGITVITGNNNTGKSTIGKVFFTCFNSLCDIELKIEDIIRKKHYTEYMEIITDALLAIPELEDISRKLNEISCSSNRMANYFEGRFFLKSDVINAYPSSSMYKDLKDAINKTEREEIKENTRDELGNLHIE